MPGNTFGQSFRITTAGESHGYGNLVIIDGLPSGISLQVDDFLPDLKRRRPGQSALTTQRREEDIPQLLTGIFDGKTTGTPLAIFIPNKDVRSADYSDIKEKYRPGHADYTFDVKFGFRDYRGGGRSSARETVVRVAAGTVAKKVLHHYGYRIKIVGFSRQIGTVVARIANPAKVRIADVEQNTVRCPDQTAASEMIRLIEQVRSERDSIGGIAEFVATGVPPGWGDPVFDKLKADLGKAMFSLPAVTAVEFGAGFAVAERRGSQNNDVFIQKGKKIVTETNNHGGILGGISSGMPIIVRCALKPTSSIPQKQQTVTTRGKETTIVTKGRHDPCLLPRFIPIGEAMIAVVLADHCLRQQVHMKKK